MLEINECLNALIDQTDNLKTQEGPQPEEYQREALPSQVALPGQAEPVSPPYYDPPEEPYMSLAGEKVIRDKDGVRWARVKVPGMPGHFMRRLPVIKRAFCGYCLEQVSGQSHLKCLKLMGRPAWKGSTHLRQVKRNPATLFL